MEYERPASIVRLVSQPELDKTQAAKAAESLTRTVQAGKAKTVLWIAFDEAGNVLTHVSENMKVSELALATAYLQDDLQTCVRQLAITKPPEAS